jgi:hypothetical protein
VQDPWRSCRRTVIRSMTIALLLAVLSVNGWGQAPDWQGQVREYAEARDWASAMRLVEQEIAEAPQDMDVRAWRARLLAWSGKLSEAPKGISGNPESLAHGSGQLDGAGKRLHA